MRGLGRLVLNVVVLDGQAPNVKVIANGDNDVDDKAAIDTKGGTKHEEHIGNLVRVAAEGAGPAKANHVGQNRPHRVKDAKGQESAENVVKGEWLLQQVGGNHLTDAVGVDEADKEGKRHEVVVKNLGVLLEVGDDEEPDGKEGDETDEGTTSTSATGAAGANDIERRLDRVENEDDGALNHVPLSKGQVVND